MDPAILRWQALPSLLRRAALVAVGLVALFVEGLACGANVSIAVEHRDDDVAIRASATLDADAPTAWRVLTDYEHYADFVPGLRSVRVVSRDGSRVVVAQSGDARFWLFSFPVDVVYQIVETPPTALRSRIVDGCGCTFESRYVLTPVGTRVRLDYTGTLVPSNDFRGLVARTAMEQSLREHLAALADAIERSAPRAAAATP